MITKIDNFLNSITMYRLVLYSLFVLSGISILFAAVGLLPYGVWPYIASFFILTWTCYFSNLGFAKLFNAKATVESSPITALILFLTLFPAVTLNDALIAVFAGVLAMASKYFVAIRREHIFNPAAFALLMLSMFGSGNVAWWIGSKILFPFSLIIGILVIRKIRRFRMVGVFLGTHLLVAGVMGISPVQSILSWPIVFFGSIMLTEPFTAPTGKRMKDAYAILVGILSAIPFHIGPVYSSPELSLMIGNLLAFMTSMKKRLDLKLVSRREIAKSIYEFSFEIPSQLHFKAGQYMEWTLPHDKQDNRGVRRYFTMSSSPTENEMKIGIKIFPESSTYKKKLLSLEKGDYIYGENLDGDFVLPPNPLEKIAFIGGGIGVTPFRSMTQYVKDKNEKRDMILLYAANTEDEIAYKDVFESLTAHYIVGKFITEEIIREKVPDFNERTFYISGPNKMVDTFKKLLKKMGVKNSRIVTDYFPGY